MTCCYWWLDSGEESEGRPSSIRHISYRLVRSISYLIGRHTDIQSYCHTLHRTQYSEYWSRHDSRQYWDQDRRGISSPSQPSNACNICNRGFPLLVVRRRYRSYRRFGPVCIHSVAFFASARLESPTFGFFDDKQMRVFIHLVCIYRLVVKEL